MADCIINESVIARNHDGLLQHSYLLCSTEKELELSEARLTIKGTRCLQQDARIGACAQVALKILIDNMPHFPRTLDEQPDPNIAQPICTPDITEIARKLPTVGREIPTKGLTFAQMVYLLRELGFEPFSYAVDSGEETLLPFETIIYRYIESGIPVLLGIETERGGHAVVVVGHTFSSDMWLPVVQENYFSKISDTKKDYVSNVRWVDDFIIMDDNTGPYLLMPKDMISGGITRTRGITKTIIIPLPKDVFMTAEEAELRANDNIQLLIEEKYQKDEDFFNHIVSAQEDTFWLKRFLRSARADQLILRSFLRSKEDFLKDISETANFNQELSEMYSDMPLPNLLWLTEISYPDIFSQSRLRCGEVLIDPTGDPQRGISVLATHLPGVVWTFNEAANTYQQCIVANDVPYKHTVRKPPVMEVA
ncbi:MAG: hypothetical protein ACYCXF_06375 [Thermoleophilia bacterium]